ncbi:hypothetical protein NA57DRAFT_82269 [Rhizodiscina lignyota]|uniref:Zn(2)-C6 fungal-type domain-containing protein n=1 Tax=Rhizodiscina lignyota TaxID=1504668 RepID=A0A9P4I089_9PEZI|nr:hypothetical protein NA57DRAFT_82269 [Rhizodiscina lignyota]
MADYVSKETFWTNARDGRPVLKRRRKNIIRACDHCKARKTKCDGVQPCSRCEALGVACTYNTPYSRGLAPPAVPIARRSDSPSGIAGPIPNPSKHIFVADLEREEGRRSIHRYSREASPDSEAEHGEGFLGRSSISVFSYATQLQLCTEQSPPPPTQDAKDPLSASVTDRTASTSPSNAPNPAGYMGSREMRRAQSWLHFCEPPFPPLDIARYTLPNRERGFEMCRWYFEIGNPTCRFLHRPTIERMVYTLCSGGEWLGSGSTRTPELSKIDECIVLMVWAMGCQYPELSSGKPLTPSERAWIQQKGTEYYQVTEFILEKENHSVDRLATLQVRFMMSLFLVRAYRVKAGWDALAVVKNMANNLDMSRWENPYRFGSDKDVPLGTYPNSQLHLHIEQRKRTFWAIYSIDSIVASMVGKSPAFEETGVKIRHPNVEYDEAFEASIIPTEKSPQSGQDSALLAEQPPLILAAIAQAKVAWVLRRALKFIYLDLDAEFDCDVADRLGDMVDRWRTELPEHLRKDAPDGLDAMRKRQWVVIKCSEQQVTMMIYRQSLPLSGLVAKRNTEGESVPGPKPWLQKYQDRCLDAANKVCEMTSKLVETKDIAGNFWFTTYINAMAATVMLVYITYHPSSPRVRTIWESAQKCYEVQRRLMHDSPLARRSVAALEDLFKHVKRRMSSLTSTSSPSTTQSGTLQHDIQRDTQGTDTPPQAHDHSYMELPIMSHHEQAAPSTSATSFPPTSAEMAGFPMDFRTQSWDEFAGVYENSSFFDLDSFVCGGQHFGWTGA